MPMTLVPTPGSPPTLWDRLPQEGPQAYRAFLTYRDLPPDTRSLQVAAGRAIVPGRWRHWCLHHHWVQRVSAWDSAQVQVRDEAHFATLVAMSRRQAQAAERTQQALTLPTEAMARKLTQADPEVVIAELVALPLPTLVRLVAAVQHAWCRAALLERLARGAITSEQALNTADSLGLYDAMISDPEIAEHAEALVRKLTGT